MPAPLAALAAAVSVAAAVAARPPPIDRPLIGRRYPSLARAVDAALESDPIVVAFGEFHQTLENRQVPSALRRFTDEILPPIAERFSHLVVETWVTTGRCGDNERAVTADIARTTERPATTESEIEGVIRAAAAGGIAPRILSISCADYAAMRPAADGAVDYDRTLKVTARALEDAVRRALAELRRLEGDQALSPRSQSRSWARHLVGVYGGALHNDVYPDGALAAYTFAPALMVATLGRYVEIDLVVPAYVAQSAAVKAQAWWRAYLGARRSGAVVMVRRSPRSFVIVLPGLAPSPVPASRPAPSQGR